MFYLIIILFINYILFSKIPKHIITIILKEKDKQFKLFIEIILYQTFVNLNSINKNTQFLSTNNHTYKKDIFFL